MILVLAFSALDTDIKLPQKKVLLFVFLDLADAIPCTFLIQFFISSFEDTVSGQTH